jgi:hypothetical protein
MSSPNELAGTHNLAVRRFELSRRQALPAPHNGRPINVEGERFRPVAGGAKAPSSATVIIRGAFHETTKDTHFRKKFCPGYRHGTLSRPTC